MSGAVGLAWDLLARDNASPAFLRVAGAADKAASATAAASAGMEKSSTRMSVAAAKISKTVGLATLGIAAASVHEAAKFQSSMTLIQTAGGETADKAKAIGAGIKKIAVDTGTSLGALADGIYTVAKAGSEKWSAADQLTVLKAAAQGAKAENVDLGVSVNALTSVMMSYHVPASQAVSVQNELIVGAGKAKTTMQEYASSLSTVVPIASAVGIKFDQVAGAIATLTQHGTSPQEATQELANLMRNLAGQNNVATAAMQQLGINTVDLAQNLGKRGLTGTLEIVDAALKAHTKDGMVVTDVHKAAALATKSLNTELSSFGGTLRTQSEGLLKGSVSISEYTKYAKSLGGQAGASALQFLALYKSSLGFSNQLRTGNGVITTSAKQLEKMLGGATGLNVALQLGGENADYFKQATAAVGKAAQGAGGDVLGWSKTQGTLAVKIGQAKANLQVLAVEIGTALIPAVSKLVGWVSKAASWFEGLSSGWKKTIATAALVVAAYTPLVFLFGKVRLAVLGLWAAAAAPARFIAGMRAAELSVAAMSTSTYGAGLRVRAAFIGMGASATEGAAAVVRADGTIIAANRSVLASMGTMKAGLGGALIGGALILPSVTGGQISAIKQLAAQYKGATNSANMSAQAIIRWAATSDNAVLPVKQVTKDLKITADQLAHGVAGTDAQYKSFLATLRKHEKISGDDAEVMGMLHKAFANTLPAINAVNKALASIPAQKVITVTADTYQAEVALSRLQRANVEPGQTTRVKLTPHVTVKAPTSPATPLTMGTPITPLPKFDTSSLSAFASAWSQTAADVRAAYASIVQSASDAGTKLPGYIGAQNKQLASMVTQRNAVTARLQKANEALGTVIGNYNNVKSTVKGAITGSFNIATAGTNQYGEPVTASAILTQIDKAAKDATKFNQLLRKLANDGLPKGLLLQLAEAGPSALAQAQALVNATPKQLAAIKADYRTINTASNSLGKFMADDMYAAGVASAKGLVKGLQSQQSQLNKAIKALGDQMIAELKRTLGIHSPSRVMFEQGVNTSLGFLRGIESKYEHVRASANRLGNAAVPAGHPSANNTSKQHNYGTYIEKQELHVHYPLEGNLNEALPQLMRLQSRAIGR